MNHDPQTHPKPHSKPNQIGPNGFALRAAKTHSHSDERPEEQGAKEHGRYSCYTAPQQGRMGKSESRAARGLTWPWLVSAGHAWSMPAMAFDFAHHRAMMGVRSRSK